MTLIATSTFLQVLLGATLAFAVMLLWAAAVADVVRHGESGLRIAGILVLILLFPILGPLLYFVFRREPDVSPESIQMLEAERRREAARRPVGGSGVYR
jgi:Phospholipase_D-nuclease N-terminal